MRGSLALTWQVARKPWHDVKSSAFDFAIMACPVKVDQFQQFMVQIVRKQIQTSNVKILHVRT